MGHRRGWVVLAGVALVIAVAVLLAPLGSKETCSAFSDGPTVCSRAGTSLLAHEGWSVLLPLSLPGLACLLPAFLRSRVVGGVVAAALLGYCVLTGFSIGLFFLPVAIGALVLAERATTAAAAPPAAPTVVSG